MPEKNRINPRCVRFSRKCEFVLWKLFVSGLESPFVCGDDVRSDFGDPLVIGFPFSLAAPFNFASATILGSVSGKQKYKYSVSVTIKNSENPAAVANGFAFTLLIVLSHAPNAGPNVKLMLKHMPTSAMVEPLFFSSETSVAMAIASCTLPSESPPTMRESRKVRKSEAHTQRRTLRTLPSMLQRRALRRPYLSEREPMRGEAIAWSRLYPYPY